MVFYDHDVLDDMEIDKHYVYFNDKIFTTVSGIVSIEAGYLQTKKEAIYGRTTDGTDVVIPAADIVSIEGAA